MRCRRLVLGLALVLARGLGSALALGLGIGLAPMASGGAASADEPGAGSRGSPPAPAPTPPTPPTPTAPAPPTPTAPTPLPAPPADLVDDELQRLVAAARGLPFLRPVERRRLDRAGLRAFVAKELEPDIASGRLGRLGQVYAKLGLTEPGADLERAAVDLYGERYIGFYDPRVGALTVLDDAWSRAEPDVLELTLAHELTHALQDQHFGLERLRAEAETDDDRALALTALVEGDAVLATELYRLLARRGLRVEPGALGDLADRGRDRIDDALERARRGASEPGAPALTDPLLFGYTHGAAFCQRAATRWRSYGALGQAFRDPPRSTEQVLHPERYLDEPRDHPLAVDFPELEAALDGEARSLYRNTMGELYTRLILGRALPEDDAVRAAAGWGGDRYEALLAPGGEVILVWCWIGDTDQDAAELAEAYGRLAERRAARGGGLAIEREGRSVWIVDGASAGMYGRIRGALRHTSIGAAGPR